MLDGDAVVEVVGLTKRFAHKAALDGVDLSVRTGTIHGLLGPNGAGKTTLLSILFGLSTADEGSVRLFGHQLHERGYSWLHGVAGFVEAPTFYPYLTGERNLTLLATLDGSAERADIHELLTMVGLENAGGKRVRGYSLGMRQRLGLAAALLRRPRLLILDEPTNGMDPAGMRDLRTALRRLADNGLTVLLSSHDMGQVSEVCDEVTMLRAGRVAITGTMSELRAAAPSPSWVLATSDDQAALALADTCPRIELTVGPDGGLRLRGQSADADAFVMDLGGARIAVQRRVEQVLPLEALFLQLTGAEPPAVHDSSAHSPAGAGR